ncbi:MULTISPECIES: carboxylating nicotinate-nucleotide diphosphorylase [Oceanospirillaceae]|jgi:nicotinate-nucleotide pyrophosphorylase (carboxylating)|uniref:Probable nicotinate-nucleotide pyrophosphorylase [carboxylating] n=1 Tax=Marinomonas piezotolerans TaxID=2213058 RepID=A0A370U494_9GAMM|nr:MULTISPECIES: carboxylating nicotinate-nucleotide diphosphorylase [Oceanospirillaceae]MAX42764.1 nicotinate-nucleotide diphosphorylase (carboxylating) [Alteromonadaceae bacterium]MCP3861525.1 carboxylating nicotinate-nucleotide diphosphorylase [Aestuariibacter sp.]RUM53564.1 MAG: carboxylating nicotinate-nucleotide diphosphorylase [Marinomonas sp.]MCP4236828.1 carboxylating nicotinate-nucleotide diphosphorylase [Aestuariibacter sp.]MCP4595050.1 carboxylating nicotinate-nucleotide diphosphor|tara:strand:- start:394 stop:1248 length:855 start_codon:yes stop_codon:yes gene_type:complete
MYKLDNTTLQIAITANVSAALTEDIASGDINALLIPESQTAIAKIITRQDAVLCGTAWVSETFRQVDPSVKLLWHFNDGDNLKADDLIVEVTGPARSLLTGERTALNFLQLMSAVATRTRYFVSKIGRNPVELIDTRKTIPGLRLAQKYAVTCGGGQNHRMGLYDAFLIKENHIAACGGIDKAVQVARTLVPNKLIEVETESLEELEQALQSGVDIIMLDNFSLEDTKKAVELSRGKAKIEASGGINDDTLIDIIQAGVDYVSMGTLTKDIKAVDLSMRLYMEA